MTEIISTTPDTGYRGLWYKMQWLNGHYKYSGGCATYPQQHEPIAIYAPEVKKTFFCYGGTVEGKQELLHMLSYFDHATATVPRPRVLLNKRTDDAHDNPTMSIDTDGHIWIFSNAHGWARPAFIHRSVEPYSIDRFEKVLEQNFSYAQPWFIRGKGLLVPHTRYTEKGYRFLYWMTSEDGRLWSEPHPLSRIEKGHYQISWRSGDAVVNAFNSHPFEGGLDFRTNLCCLITRDFGETWTNAAGEKVTLPIEEFDNPALVAEYRSKGINVYLKDVQLDAEGNPVILVITSGGYAPGPANDPRTWTTFRWTGSEWDVRPVTTSSHNYDFGPLYIEPDGTWRIIAPTDPGPQPIDTGGEVVMWTSRDRGASWTKAKQLTHDSRYNHTYVRKPLNAHDDFYALWADGDCMEPSPSSIYFTNRTGTRVWKLPERMTTDRAEPKVVFSG